MPSWGLDVCSMTVSPTPYKPWERGSVVSISLVRKLGTGKCHTGGQGGVGVWACSGSLCWCSHTAVTAPGAVSRS